MAHARGYPGDWFNTGGTTEITGNFVPVDERLVSFFVSRNRKCKNGVRNQECRGRSPLPGCGVSPQISFSLAAAGGKKGQILMNIMQQDILQQLQQLQQDAQTALTQATTTESIREWHSEYLSRKGRLTSILRNLGNLSTEERPLVGKVANEVKVALEHALQERQTAIAV